MPLAAAVKYAHAQGMIHRDIKPGNIMYTQDDQVVLADFGIAYMIDNPEYTGTGAFIGTPSFMSPEQCRTSTVDERSDIYALGVLLFLLLTGQTPFRGGNPTFSFCRSPRTRCGLPGSVRVAPRSSYLWLASSRFPSGAGKKSGPPVGFRSPPGQVAQRAFDASMLDAEDEQIGRSATRSHRQEAKSAQMDPRCCYHPTHRIPSKQEALEFHHA